MPVPNVLPAGLPRGLVRVRQRLQGFFEGAPVLFIGVTLGVAVLFRLAIPFLRAPAEPDPSSTGVAQVSAPSAPLAPDTPSASSAPQASITSLHAPVEGPAATAAAARGGSPSILAGGAAPPRGLAHPVPPRRKPRAHGRR